MNEIRTRIVVGPDHRIVGTTPVELPPGEHEVTITLAPEALRTKAAHPFDLDSLPSHDMGPWPRGMSLRREDIYDDEGR